MPLLFGFAAPAIHVGLLAATSTTTAKTTSSSSSFSFLIIIVLIFAGYYFVIRPQRARQRQQMQVQRQFDVGDEVVTTGGMIGRVRSINDDRVTLEISPGTSIEVLQTAIARRLDTYPRNDPDAPLTGLDSPPSGRPDDPTTPPPEGTS